MLQNLKEFESGTEMSCYSDLKVFMLFYRQTATCLHRGDAPLSIWTYVFRRLCAAGAESTIFVDLELGPESAAVMRRSNVGIRSV